MTIAIRRTEPSDFEAVRAIFMGAQAVRGTLQLPFPSVEQMGAMWMHTRWHDYEKYQAKTERQTRASEGYNE